MPQRTTRLIAAILMLFWVALLVVAFAVGEYNAEHTRRSHHLLQLSTSPLLLLVAVVLWLGGGVPAGAAVAAGMALSLVGDLVMGGHIRTPNSMVFGMLSFGAAHVCYITAWLRMGRALGKPPRRTQVAAIVTMCAVGVALWWLLVQTPQAETVLNVGSLGYCLLLCGMAGVALALAIEHPRLAGIAVGAVLFVASDVILGNQVLRGAHWFLVGDMVWWTYIGGQALMVCTSGLARVGVEDSGTPSQA